MLHTTSGANHLIFSMLLVLPTHRGFLSFSDVSAYVMHQLPWWPVREKPKVCKKAYLTWGSNAVVVIFSKITMWQDWWTYSLTQIHSSICIGSLTSSIWLHRSYLPKNHILEVIVAYVLTSAIFLFSIRKKICWWHQFMDLILISW